MKAKKTAYWDEDICQMLGGISRRTLNNKVSRGIVPDTFYKIKGAKRRFWLMKETDDWFEKNKIIAGAPNVEL